MNSRSILTLADVRVDLPGGHSICFGSAELNFSKHPLILLGGDNGAGKTTLLNVLSGLCPFSAGTVSMGSAYSVCAREMRFVNLPVARGFQSPLLCDELTVWENVSLPLFDRWWTRARRYRGEAVEELTHLSLQHLADRSTGELSFGQRRLVELLRIRLQVRYQQSQLVLLDEPIAGLDPTHRALAGAMISTLAESHTGILLVEHDPSTKDLFPRSGLAELLVCNDGSRALWTEDGTRVQPAGQD